MNGKSLGKESNDTYCNKRQDDEEIDDWVEADETEQTEDKSPITFY